MRSFPKQGWCLGHNPALGVFLGIETDSEYKPPGANGYAWNETSYWTIDYTSSKQVYNYEYIKTFFIKNLSAKDKTSVKIDLNVCSKEQPIPQKKCYKRRTKRIRFQERNLIVGTGGKPSNINFTSLYSEARTKVFDTEALRNQLYFLRRKNLLRRIKR